MRQRFRNALVFISLLAFPITINFFSPYLSMNGAVKGIVSGSLALFGILFFLSLVLGRAFCGWACPVGCFQDICQRISNRRRRKAHWVKYVIWGPWFALIVGLAVKAGGFQRIDFLFMMDSFVSTDEPLRYITYYFVLFVFFVLAVAIGRHAFCHYSCWIAPFMIIGRKIRNIFGWPSLQLASHPDKCIDCMTCSKNCPMSIDVNSGVKKSDVEHSDCILCGQCVDNCRQKAIAYSFGLRKRPHPPSRT